jgi:hypothetical protein
MHSLKVGMHLMCIVPFHLLGFLVGELAPGVVATIKITGCPVDFVVTHMGNEEDVLDRELQARTLARELRRA